MFQQRLFLRVFGEWCKEMYEKHKNFKCLLIDSWWLKKGSTYKLLPSDVLLTFDELGGFSKKGKHWFVRVTDEKTMYGNLLKEGIGWKSKLVRDFETFRRVLDEIEEKLAEP